MIFLWAKSMQAKQDWEMPCILFIVCSQHSTICFKRQAVGRSKAALPFVSPSYSIKTEWNVLSDPWHLGESQGILAYCFARTLLTDLCHTFPFILGYASLPRCLWIRCLWPFPVSFSLHPLLNSVVNAMSALWFAVPYLCLSQLEFLVLTFLSIFSSQVSVWFPQA